MSPTNLRPGRLALTAVLAAVLFGGASASAAPAWPTHTCGHFFHTSNDVIVLNGGGVTCTKATKLIRAFWSGTGITQHGTSDATSYWTIAAFPGWRCGQSAGAGECTRGKEIAAYEVKGKY